MGSAEIFSPNPKWIPKLGASKNKALRCADSYLKQHPKNKKPLILTGIFALAVEHQALTL
jgi:hypothetical protein